MNRRIINSLGLFIFGLAYGLFFIIFGFFMSGAGHGTTFFYLLATSPCHYLNNTSFSGSVLLFWPVLFAYLPWCHKRSVFMLIIIALVGHYAGILHGCLRGDTYGLKEMADIAPGLVLAMTSIYITAQLAVIFLLVRWHKRPT